MLMVGGKLNNISYGHIRERNVLILDRDDSIAKHKRNLVLAVWAIVAVIFFPLGLHHLCEEIHREIVIREINQLIPKLSYKNCVDLSHCQDKNGIFVNGELVCNPIDYKSEKERMRFKWTRNAFDISVVALVVIAVACLAI